MSEEKKPVDQQEKPVGKQKKPTARGTKVVNLRKGDFVVDGIKFAAGEEKILSADDFKKPAVKRAIETNQIAKA